MAEIALLSAHMAMNAHFYNGLTEGHHRAILREEPPHRLIRCCVAPESPLEVEQYGASRSV